MAFVSMKELLREAKNQHYAIGQFNINGLQWTKAILQAAEEERSPVIAAASDRLIDYLGGFKTVSAMVPSSCTLITEAVLNAVNRRLTQGSAL